MLYEVITPAAPEACASAATRASRRSGVPRTGSQHKSNASVCKASPVRTAVAGTWRRELLDLQRVLAAEVRETIRPTSRERTSEIQASVLEATARAGLADKLRNNFV